MSHLLSRCHTIPPSLPSSLSRPLCPHSDNHLSSSHFLPTSFFSTLLIFTPCSASSSSPPPYFICIHLLPDLLCHKTANCLICLPSLFFYLSSIAALPSSPPSPSPSSPSCPASTSLLSKPCLPFPHSFLFLTRFCRPVISPVCLLPSSISSFPPSFPPGDVTKSFRLTFKKLLIKFCCSSHYRRQRGRQRGGGIKGRSRGQTG